MNPAINSSPKSNWARWVLIMCAPQAISLLPQLLLIALADLLQNLAHAIQICDLPTHLGNLIGMERDLTGFRAGIIHVQNPLAMAFATGAGSAGDRRGMKSMTFEHRAAQQVVQWRKLGDQFASGLSQAGSVCHLYRCYSSRPMPVNTFLQKMFRPKRSAAAVNPLLCALAVCGSRNPFDPAQKPTDSISE